MRGPVRAWALERMGHGGLLAVMERGALAWALNNITERPAFKSANPTPPITMQTPRRDAAKGISDIVTLCLFPMQGGKSASTEGTLRGGGAAGGGDTRAGGGGAATRRGGVAASERQREGLRLGGGRPWVLWGRGRRDRCAGERGVPRGNKARGCFRWRHCNEAGVGGTRREHRNRVKRRGKFERAKLRLYEGENPRRQMSIFYAVACLLEFEASPLGGYATAPPPSGTSW